MGAYGEFTPGIGSNELRIDEGLVNRLEAAKGKEKRNLKFLTAVTVIHEHTHYGDDQNGIDTPGEEGNMLEIASFNRVVNDANAEQSRKEFRKKQIIRILILGIINN